MDSMKIKIAFLILFCLRLQGLDEYNDSSAIAIYAKDLQEEQASNQFYSLSRYSPYPSSLSLQTPIQLTQWDILRALVKAPRFCAHRYNLSPKQISDLLQSPYKNIVQDLMKLDHLTDPGIQELWNLYKHGCSRSGKVRQAEYVLKNALELRKQQRDEAIKQQKAAQEYLNHLKKMYNPSFLMNGDYQSVYQKERELALQKTVQQNYVQHEQTYEIDEQVAGVLMAHGKDYQQYQALSGTVLQHQLFKESLSCIKKVAKRCFNAGLHTMLLGSSSIDFASAGFLATELELIELAVASNDMAEFLAETLESISVGIVKAACNVVDQFVLHPKQAAENFSYMLISVLQILGGAANQYDAGLVPIFNARSSQEAFDKNLLVCNKLCADLKEDFSKKSFQGKVESGTEFLVEGALFSKVLSCSSNACLGILKHVKNVPVLERLSPVVDFIEMLNDFSLAPKSDPMLATSAGEAISIKEIENAFIDMMESDGEAIFRAKLPYDIWPADKIIEMVKFYKNEIPLAEQELLANLKYFVEKRLSQSSETISKNVRKDFEIVQKVIEGNATSIKSDLDHVANFGYKIEKDLDRGIATFRLDGGHLAGSVKKLEKAGLIIIKKEEMLKCGCKGYLIEDVLTGKIMYKTEFPKGWDLDKIMRKIYDEAFDNLIRRDVASEGKRLVLIGKTDDGVFLKMVLDKIDDGYKLVTAMPNY